MYKKIINDIVWWIPFKKLRNNVRIILNYFLEKTAKLDCYLGLLEFKETIEAGGGGGYFQGQMGQDYIAYLALKNKKNGFYIDIGANDGKTFSNTYIFEQLGWDGICVEANPNTFKKLQENRKCHMYNCAVVLNSTGTAKFITSSVSGLDTLEMFDADYQKAKRTSIGINETEVIEVKTMTFNDIMKDFKDITYIDFMSLDIEGGEVDVLNSIDFNKYSFGLLTIEFSGHTYEPIMNIMKNNGYKLLVINSCDLMFIKDKKDQLTI